MGLKSLRLEWKDLAATFSFDSTDTHTHTHIVEERLPRGKGSMASSKIDTSSILNTNVVDQEREEFLTTTTRVIGRDTPIQSFL